MERSFCYWTVVDGEHTTMAEAMIGSARCVGVREDFHVWADRPVAGATSHKLGRLEKWGWLFKLTYLRDAASKLPYDYLVWLDADTWFVRHPGDPLRVLHGSPVHVSLETDLTHPAVALEQWWGLRIPEFISLVRARGVTHKPVYSTNTGFFVVHRDAIDAFFGLAFEFWQYCDQIGHRLVDEPIFVYAMQMLCGNPRLHTLEANADVWASDWTGVYKDRLPDGQPWEFPDPFTRRPLVVNPAIVHAMRSKPALLRSGRNMAAP